MTIAVDIFNMDGEFFTLEAKDDWSISTLKRKIESATGTVPWMQKLIAMDGDELVNGPLRQFCSENLDSMSITLVKIYMAQHEKSEEELEWESKWAKTAPICLQKAVEQPLGYGQIHELVQDYTSNPGSYTGVCHVRGGFPTFHPDHPHPTKVLPTDRLDTPADTKLPPLADGAEVLALVKKTHLDLESLTTEKKQVTLRWQKSGRTGVERVATREAVIEAIMEDPCAMLDIRCTDDSDCTELVLEALRLCPGLYSRLPDYMTEDCEILYAAMESDPGLERDFLRTADKHDIRNWQEWRWPMGKSHCRWSKRCRNALD